MGHDPTETDWLSTASPWWQVIAAPWACMFRPEAAARRMVTGPRWACWGTALLCTVICVAVVVLLALVAGQADWSMFEGSSEQRTIGEVWRGWHTDYGIGVWITFLNGVWIPVGIAVAAWLFLPSVHRDGSVWTSYKRAFVAVSGCSGLAILLIALIGSIIVWLTDHIGDPEADVAYASLILIMPGGAWLLVFWVGRAARGVVAGTLEVEIPLRCEGCGYDLTHLSIEGRCTECGLDLDSSLAPEQRRPGSAWEKTGSAWSWLCTTVAVLFRPQAFYGSLKLRTSSVAFGRFSRWQYFVIGVAAAVWMGGAVVLIDGRRSLTGEDYGPAVLIGLVVPLVGWGVHTVIGAIMASWCVARGLVPDVCWVRKVQCYETAFLWAFCLFNGTFLSAIFAWGPAALSKLFGPFTIYAVLGMPAAEFILVSGNGLLCVLWMLRYRVAIYAVRWSNY